MNIFFIGIGCIALVPDLNPARQLPAVFFVIAVIMFCSMIKDGIEDTKRYLNDRKENLRKTRVYHPRKKEFKEIDWEDVKVGSVVEIHKDEFFPADILFLKSS